MAKKQEKQLTPEDFMRMSIDLMKQCKQEPRRDNKVSPSVGAVLVFPDGSYVTSYRGELRQGDHAEYTAIERKCVDKRLDGATIYATLEPCAPDSRKFPKRGCSKRITNARISTVYVGIEDPDPTVCRKGIQHLIDNGVEVKFYPRELAEEISRYNEAFLIQAKERAREAENVTDEVWLSETEKIVMEAILDDMNLELLDDFRKRCKILGNLTSNSVLRQFAHLGILAKEGEKYHPTGLGILLFGQNPQMMYPNSVVRLMVSANGREDVKTIEGPLVLQPKQVEDWIKDKLQSWINRTSAAREREYEYPLDAIREIVNNAIVHRDYDIAGAPIQVELTEDALIVKSPGLPVLPITMEQIVDFSAPTLSRNPKLIYVFDKFDLAEQRGLGFKTVRSLPEHNVPLPIVRYESPYLIVTMPLLHGMDSVSDASRIYDFVKLNSLCAKQKVASELGIPSRTVERILKQLVEEKKLTKDGAGPSTRYRAIE